MIGHSRRVNRRFPRDCQRSPTSPATGVPFGNRRNSNELAAFWTGAATASAGPFLAEAGVYKGGSRSKRLKMDLQVLAGRIRSEFDEMPGLHLTPAEASRLWGLDREACLAVIDVLVAAAFLRWTPRGTVVRAST